MTNESPTPDENSWKQELSLFDKLILVLCVVGVILATYFALDASGLTLFDEHAAEVIADSWSSTATIGLIVALVVASIVGAFIWLLARATVGNPADDSIEDAYTQDMVPE